MKFLNKIKDGVKMVKDKTVNTIERIGIAFKNRENRVLIGVLFLGLGGSLVISGYMKLPE